MTKAELIEKVRYAFNEAFNKGLIDEFDVIFSPNMVDRSIAASAGQTGLTGFKSRIAGHRSGFPDIRFTIEEIFCDSDKIAYTWTMSGTHLGSWMGKNATGRVMMMRGMNFERLENNLIVEHWSNPDLLGAFQQLGIIPR